LTTIGQGIASKEKKNLLPEKKEKVHQFDRQKMFVSTPRSGRVGVAFPGKHKLKKEKEDEYRM